MAYLKEVTDSNLDEYLSGGAFDPPHPGLILDAIIRQRKVSVADAARQMGFSEDILDKILHGKVKISDENADAIAKYAKNFPVFWTRAQKVHDLWKARQNRRENHPSPA